MSSGITTLPIVSAHDHPFCHRLLSRLPRYSNETPRANSATSSSTTARYSAENIVAYHPGNAANIDAPATISQTSLPSHHGPMVLIATRRSVSVLPITRCSAPTPKSNPSSTKKPTQRTAMMTNQIVWSCMWGQ